MLYMILQLFSVLTTTQPITLDAIVFNQLDEAVESKDARVLPLALSVLEKIPSGSLIYSSETNERAFELVRIFAPQNAVPFLRSIARMEFRQERGPRQTRELIAIQRALSVLADMHDSEVVELSLERLGSDSWLQLSALESLSTMQAWDATPKILARMKDVDFDDEHLVVVVQLLRYLRRSPHATAEPSVCPLISRISRAYDYCFSDPKQAWRCRDLVESVVDLKARLNCCGE